MRRSGTPLGAAAASGFAAGGTSKAGFALGQAAMSGFDNEGILYGLFTRQGTACGVTFIPPKPASPP